MKFEEIREILNRQLLKLENRCLNDTEQLLLRGLWQKKNYQEIAQENGYSSGYLANVVAPGLYYRVSQLIGEPINKKNFYLDYNLILPTPHRFSIAVRNISKMSVQNTQMLLFPIILIII